MKKVIYKQFGDTDVLQQDETQIPALGSDDILVKIKAASINPLDWKLFLGEMKLMAGKKFPKAVGIDFSGVIEAVGTASSNFKIGDEVIGLVDIFKGGAMAEYVVTKERNLAIKPGNLSFEQAAALPVAGLSALQILTKLASIKTGTEILIHGATGGIGMFLTQFAKKRGGIVTAVTNTKGIALVKKWQSDYSIDYYKQDVFKLDKQFDVVVDLSGKMTFNAVKALLKKKASFINTLPSPGGMITSFVNNLFSQRKYQILVLKPSAENINILAHEAERNLDVIIDKVFPIKSIKEAYDYAMKGGILGKVIITLE